MVEQVHWCDIGKKNVYQKRGPMINLQDHKEAHRG